MNQELLLVPVEFRQLSWKTERSWEILKHYDIVVVITEYPAKEKFASPI
jgi:hypothetical protein